MVTLIACPDAKCWGVAYRVAGAARERVLERLDARESGGYERQILPFYQHAARSLAHDVLVYVASQSNPNYVGPEEDQRVVSMIAAARGLSGGNSEYALSLAQALRAMGAHDSHVFEIARGLRGAHAAAAPRGQASRRSAARVAPSSGVDRPRRARAR